MNGLTAYLQYVLKSIQILLRGLQCIVLIWTKEKYLKQLRKEF